MEFQPFQIEDKPEIDAFLKPLKPEASELTFTYMIMWGQDGKFTWAVEDDVLYVLVRFGEKYPPFLLPPVPKDMGMDYAHAVAKGCEALAAIGAKPKFRSISGPFVPLFEQHAPGLRLLHERDSDDYVYLAEDLITLRGKKLHGKRNHINQFRSRYSFEYRPLRPEDEGACMELYLGWLQEKDVFAPGILGEMKGLRFLLPNMEQLGVKGGAIFVDGRMAAFTLGEQLSPDMALIHIEKADSAIPGLYPLINQQFAEHEWSGVTYINREEDMGVEGLRKAKLSYHPVRMTEKFAAVPKDTE